jgi:AcrR family transcriptional regulator
MSIVVFGEVRRFQYAPRARRYAASVAVPRSTEEGILEGALRAVARHGVRRLSMSDICEEAGVSRGTLYRYFNSKEEILEAATNRLGAEMRRSLEEAVAANPALPDRVRVVLKVAITHADKYAHTRRFVQLEPRAALDSMVENLPLLVTLLGEYLEPALATSAPVLQGVLTSRHITDLFVRLVFSSFLLPATGTRGLDSRVADLWEAMTGEPGGRPADASPTGICAVH